MTSRISDHPTPKLSPDSADLPLGPARPFSLDKASRPEQVSVWMGTVPETSVDVRVDTATLHLRDLVASDLEFVRDALSNHLESDPTMHELLGRGRKTPTAG